VDVPRFGARRAQRAYFDSVRDLAAPVFGNGPVIRVPAADCDGAIAYDRSGYRKSSRGSAVAVLTNTDAHL
jgi:hypothetical protein